MIFTFIYGYKDKEIISFSEYIKNGGFSGKSLTQGFKDYAALTNKSAGSVRNLYYALAKFSHSDSDFTEKYLGGKPLHVERGASFSENEKNILRKITDFKNRGVSVRKATFILANGDAKKALRYQNKYRADLSKALREKTNSEFKTGSGFAVKIPYGKVEDFAYKRLKTEIDRLAERLTVSLKKENAALKKELCALKAENLRLYKKTQGEKSRVTEYFMKKGGAYPDSVMPR